MVFQDVCQMMGGSYGYGIWYLNVIFAAIIFAAIFWGIYYIMIKGKTGKGKK